MKKWVELQVATKPCGSSISASSAPASIAWMQAVMQLSFECELSLGSCTAGIAAADVDGEQGDALLDHRRQRLPYIRGR